jgi:hypothetical protein
MILASFGLKRSGQGEIIGTWPRVHKYNKGTQISFRLVKTVILILIPMYTHPPFSAMCGDFPFHVEKPSLFLHGKPHALGVF